MMKCVLKPSDAGYGRWADKFVVAWEDKMIVDVVQIAKDIEIRRIRRLPVSGRVLVKNGEPVHPQDVIAEALIPGNVLMLDIARGLGLPPEEVKTCLMREAGEELKEGDVIAQCEGAFPRLVRAPVEGVLLDIHKGEAALATGHSKIELHAGMIGEVEVVIAGYGATLSARGSLLQGMWGNGKMGEGVIVVPESPLETPIRASSLRKLESGQMMAGGVCLHAEVLTACESAGISGLILGALAPELVPMAAALPFPVIVLQGFGALLPDPNILECLQDRSGDTAAINAQAVDIFKGERPEVIIPHDTETPSPALGFREGLKVGQRVRVMSGTAMGQSGTLIELTDTTTPLESGLASIAALVQLTSGETVSVPAHNLVIVNH